MRTDWLDWRPEWNGWHIAEGGVISLLALALAWWATPADPLGLAGGFPWAWLGPLLIALRYGMLAGLLGAGLQLLVWMGWGLHGVLPAALPQAPFFGALILVMLCGEFSGLWRNRLRRLTELNHYHDQRLEELTRQHHLLKLSHDRLEQNLISRPYTLRGALAELRTLPMPADDSNPLPHAQAFMQLVAAHCQLSVAALYPVAADRIAPTPTAHCGEPGTLIADDPLIAHALAQRALTYIHQPDGVDETASRYLVAAPIYSGERLDGLLVVEKMPFFAYHHDTLQTLAALIAYYADLYETGGTLTGHPDCPPAFCRQLGKLAAMQRASGVVSHLVQLRFPVSDQARALRDRLARSKRELDFYWSRDAAEPQLIALLPLTDPDGVRGFLARIDAWLTQHSGADALELGIRTSSTPLDPQAPYAQLEGLLDAA
ncbi:MAG: PelD GGDEF domain-containing protein [Thiobacillus sp.]